MKILPNAISRHAGLLLAIVLFVLTRALTLTTFPIFNDEAIYLQYSRSIHDDWEKNKFISMNGEFRDWKPPLQYWMAAPVIRWGGDLLVAGRVVAALVSFLGLFGFYLFTKEFFSQREAVMAAMLYVMCPPVLFHNNQFTAETFLFSTAPFLYWSLLKAMRPRQGKWVWAIIAILLGTTLLLFKQSGALFLAVAIALPFAQLRRKERSAERMPNAAMRRWAGAWWNWKEFAVNLSVLAAIILCSHFAASLIIPPEFNDTKEQFNGHWVMSLREIFQLPLETWRANLQIVGEYIDSYYSWSVVLFFCTFLWFAFQKRNFAELALASMCLAGGGAVIFLLRGFNEYLFNTSVIVVLLPLLARTGVIVWNLGRDGKESLVRAGLLILAAGMLAFWGYQIVLMYCSPGKYIERSTSWAAANYLKSWPTGFGVKEVVAMLEKEKEPGVIFIDTQWGNPATALQIYGKDRFPNLRLVPVSREFLDASETRKLRDAAKKIGRSHYAIFSADSSEGREQWLGNIEREMCETRTEVRAYPGQMPIIVCRF
jgi:4-amino-4-deoxy-L-arabinose transferase-like glycosyltransferase